VKADRVTAGRIDDPVLFLLDGFPEYWQALPPVLLFSGKRDPSGVKGTCAGEL
jgi:hypothetical protein